MPSVIDDYKFIGERLRQIGHEDPFRNASKPKGAPLKPEELRCNLCGTVNNCTGECGVGY